MNKKLKDITDITINQLLNQDIIMPSQYYTTFDTNAKDKHMYIHDEEFEKEINEVIQEEFKKINDYMNHTIKNIDDLESVTSNVENAIKNKDLKELMKANQHIKKLKENIISLQNEIYTDDLTKKYNRKYLNMKFLNSDDRFSKKGTMVLIDINNFEKIIKKYGQLIGDNVIRFTVSFIEKKLEKEISSYSFIHYSRDKFIIFFKNHTEDELKSLFNNIRLELLNKTVKSKSGHIINIIFSFAVLQYQKNDKFYPLLLNADDMIKEDRFKLKA
jgi:diguanylate cyclase (GGDEF)-like protein